MMRYAKLKTDWLLRGWNDRQRVLLNWRTGECRVLSMDLFRTAIACDGSSDFDSIQVLPRSKVLLEILLSAEIAEECRSGTEIFNWQHYRKADNPYIRGIHWAITGRCNLACRHCCMESPDGKYGELMTADVLDLIEQFAAANVHQVHLSGGEPLLRDDFLEIIKKLQDKQIRVTRIYSNGTLLTEKILQELEQMGCLPQFQISFDGCRSHDAMRGVEGAEAATIEALRLLRRRGFDVIVATSIDSMNVASLAQTYELMKQVGIQQWRIAPPIQVGNWRYNNTSLDWDAMMKYCGEVKQRWSDERANFSLQVPLYQKRGMDGLPEAFTEESYDCLICRDTPTVLADGKVVPCPLYADSAVYERMPSLRESCFATVWTQSSLRELLDLKKRTVLEHNKQCSACETFKDCGAGCRASALAATGELLALDPQACAIYKKTSS